MSPPSASCEIAVKVTPRSSRNKVEVTNDSLRVWVTAPPTDGQANDAVCEVIAKSLKLAKFRIIVVSGHTSKQKRVRIDGLDLQEVMNRLGGGSLF